MQHITAEQESDVAEARQAVKEFLKAQELALAGQEPLKAGQEPQAGQENTLNLSLSQQPFLSPPPNPIPFQTLASEITTFTYASFINLIISEARGRPRMGAGRGRPLHSKSCQGDSFLPASVKLRSASPPSATPLRPCTRKAWSGSLDVIKEEVVEPPLPPPSLSPPPSWEVLVSAMENFADWDEMVEYWSLGERELVIVEEKLWGLLADSTVQLGLLRTYLTY